MARKVRTLEVDMIACAGHGICAELLAEWVRLDDWGYPIIRREAVPPELLAQARWAVSNCPALALKLRTKKAPPGPGWRGRPGGSPSLQG